MRDEPANGDAPLEEQLVAYLDGELDAEAGRRIDDLLVSNVEVRAKLEGLDRTWDLLDELGTSPVAESFARSTLEMVTLAAAGDARRSLAEAPRRRRRRWAITGGSLLAAGLAGFLSVAWLWPDRNEQLVRDLPVLERLDELREREAGRPSAEDLQGLFRWMRQYVVEHEDRILKTLPAPFRREVLEMERPMRQRAVMRWMWDHWLQKPRRGRMLSERDLASLRSSLSEKTRRQLEGRSREEQLRTLAGWIRMAVHDQIRHGGGLPFLARPEQLGHIFERLPESEQNRLLSLPGDELQAELWKRAPMQRSRGPRRPHPPDLPGGKRPGPLNPPGPPHRERRRSPQPREEFQRPGFPPHGPGPGAPPHPGPLIPPDHER